MDIDATDPNEPVDPDEPIDPDDDQAQAAAPLPWWRRKAVLAGTALLAVLALIGSLVLAFSGSSPKQQAAIKPRGVHPTEAPIPSTSAPETPIDSGFLSGDLLGGDSATSSSYDSGANQSPMAATGPALGLTAAPAFSPPPAGSLPTASLPAAPPLDWAALINPYLAAQSNAQAANVASAITGSALGVLNSAAILVGDLILFAAISDNGPQILAQLQTALPSAPALAAAAQAATANFPQLPAPPDYTGLTAAFAAAANLPPLAVPQLPALPAPPPGLPSLPTPEQLLALGTLPAIGLPALPPPPPIGFPALPAFGPPQLPPPPDLSFLFFVPAFGLPSFGLPSITRLLGLPF